MATGAQTWSTSAASNSAADGSVNWAEGMAPSAVNNSARAEMASAAMWIGDNSGILLTAGSSSAFTVSSKQVSTGVVDGYTIAVRFHATNDTSATLNVDGVGAKNLQTRTGSNVGGNECLAGSIQRFTYTTSSTAWVLHGPTNPGATAALSVKSVTLSSAATIGSSLTVAGDTLFSGASVMSTGLIVSGPSHFGNTLLVDGDLTAPSVSGDVIATQANQESGSVANLIVTPARQHYHPSAAKAWAYVTVAAGSPTLVNGYNAASVTDVASGQTKVNFTNALSAATYVAVATVDTTSTNTLGASAKVAADGVTVTTWGASGGLDNTNFMVVVFGDL